MSRKYGSPTVGHLDTSLIGEIGSTIFIQQIMFRCHLVTMAFTVRQAREQFLSKSSSTAVGAVDIDDVLYVPQIKKNLFSVGVCTTKGFDVHFRSRQVLFSRDGEMIAQGIKQGNEIYRMFFKVIFREEVNMSLVSLQTWHEWLGHINKRTLREMVAKELVEGIKLSDISNFFCEPC